MCPHYCSVRAYKKDLSIRKYFPEEILFLSVMQKRVKGYLGTEKNVRIDRLRTCHVKRPNHERQVSISIGSKCACGVCVVYECQME